MSKRKFFVYFCIWNIISWVMIAVVSQPFINDSVNLRSPSPDVDGVSASPCTSSDLRTDGQPEVGRGLPSIDDIAVPDMKVVFGCYFVAFYIVVFLYGIELMMFHIGIVLVSYLIEKETDTKTAKIYRSMMVYSKQNIFLLLYGYNECERRKAIENIDSFFRKHKLLRVFAA